MSSLKARKTNISRVEHLQRAHFKNYYEMKRFVEEREILCRDHRRSMFLINKEIQELQKTLIDINLISGYCHEAYSAHLRSVSTAFSTCQESKKAKKCGNIDVNVKSANSKSNHMFGQKHDALADETSNDCKRDLSELRQHTPTTETYKTCRANTYVSPRKDLKNSQDDFKASLSHSELSSSECNEKDEDKSDGCPQKSPSHITKTYLKNSSSPPTHFTLHRRAKQAHQRRQKVALHMPAVLRNPFHEQGMAIQLQGQDGKTLSRYLQNKDSMNSGRSHISKTAIKHSLGLLIKEYNCSQNADILKNNKHRDLNEKVSNFVSALSEFRCDV
ncbi:hypothetical protein QQF64_014949 [Cirrhinus molitorella]|uniref:Uncharacterized protein n=1 Tax=Cirrhinus molitorella TaxID=172907 RepID=A0ABR3NTK2_9TELE